MHILVNFYLYASEYLINPERVDMKAYNERQYKSRILELSSFLVRNSYSYEVIHSREQFISRIASGRYLRRSSRHLVYQSKACITPLYSTSPVCRQTQPPPFFTAPFSRFPPVPHRHSHAFTENWELSLEVPLNILRGSQSIYYSSNYI